MGACCFSDALLRCVVQAVAASPVGTAARAVQTRVSDRIEDAREVWETSQHPLIVSASSAVDTVLAESEQARGVTCCSRRHFHPHCGAMLCARPP